MLYVIYLEHEALLWLQFEVARCMFDGLLKVQLSLARDVQRGEQVGDQAYF